MSANGREETAWVTNQWSVHTDIYSLLTWDLLVAQTAIQSIPAISQAKPSASKPSALKGIMRDGYTPAHRPTSSSSNKARQTAVHSKPAAIKSKTARKPGHARGVLTEEASTDKGSNADWVGKSAERSLHRPNAVSGLLGCIQRSSVLCCEVTIHNVPAAVSCSLVSDHHHHPSIKLSTSIVIAQTRERCWKDEMKCDTSSK